MTDRPVCSTNLSFGLVNVPVRVMLASSEKKCHLHWLSPKGNRVSQRYVDSVTGEKVPHNEIRLGYEVEKNVFKVIHKKDLESIVKDGITVLESVPRIKLLPHLVQRSFYLQHDKSERAYRVIQAALNRVKRDLICKWYTRSKDCLVVVQATPSALVMHQVYYKDEVRECRTNFSKVVRLSREEILLASQMIQQMEGTTFNFESYQDEYGKRFKKMLEQKYRGSFQTLLKKSLKK